MRLLLAVGLGVALLLAGCGYSTSSRRAKDIKSIAVPFFDNRTTEPNLEIRVTEQIINFLVADNTLKVVDEADADAVLDGAIVTFRRNPFSFNSDLNAEEYRLQVVVRATLFNRRTNQPIWEGKTLEGSASFFVDTVSEGLTYDEAVEESIRQITDRILNLTVQDW